ncbi:BTAD domain-containing putative transcriptional regulator [Streptacidiphilus sp. PB12-B1b]|uniref:AfsR/SARP family transcriptional regulator n=1 Tax=Streptacidiphilus sp. PB12-B1b TaxID=2705012 RepID=UPI001CDB5BAE|nr:BTAD domain-containing putative transcriptional regulator [Streptacidiphilus sp. PB12-B1b]
MGGRKVNIGGPRQRTILALLLLSPGRIVSVDTLVDEVWQGRPPATARTQVAICIAALRKQLKAEGFAEEIIATAHPGYLLNAEGHDVDATDFTRQIAAAERAVTEARTAEAAQAYRRALALWSGPALAGVSGRLVEDEAQRLEELRLNACDDSFAVQLELGNHQELIPELAAMVREHPLRERLRHHLMTAQYRAGRRAEAMETFRSARRQLIDELGLEPGPELQELHRAILRDDPSLLTVADSESQPTALVVPSELPPDVPGFTGRDSELAALDALLIPHQTGEGPAVGLVTGVAGVGKTGLAVCWAHRNSEQFPDGRLFADLRGYDEHHEATAAGEVLSRFLRSLGVPSENIPAELESRIALYRSVLADRRVLIVLDNVHAFAQIRPLLPGSEGCCVLVTSRDQLEQLVTWPPQARVLLGLLPQAHALELLGRIVGEARIAAARPDALRLVELCDRLPLALRIAAARLASKPHWMVRHLVARLDDEQRRLDELSQGESQIRASLALSYRYLPADASRLYRRLGLLPVPDFTDWAAAALLDVPLLDAEALIEHLVDAQFLEVVGLDATGRLRYRFQNLLRLYARERAEQQEPEADRRESLERFYRTSLTLAELAHQREYGGDYSVIHGATPRRALDRALVDDLLQAPLEWFESERLSLLAVVEGAADAGLDDLAWDLAMCMVPLFETRNYVDDWRESCRTALTAAEAAGNPRGQGAMLHGLGAVALRLRRLEEAQGYISRALELFQAAGEEHGRALALRNLAIADRMRGHLGRARSSLEEARATFHTVGDHSSEAHVLNNLAQIELDLGHPDEAMAFAREAVGLSETIGVGGARGVAMGLHRLARAYLAKGWLDAAQEAFLRVVRIVKEKSDTVGLAYALLGLGEARMEAGALDEAEGTLVDALDIAVQIDSPLVEGQIRLALGEVCAKQGCRAQAAGYLTAAQETFARIGAPSWQARVDSVIATLGLVESDTTEFLQQ